MEALLLPFMFPVIMLLLIFGPIGSIAFVVAFLSALFSDE